jgi:hypothetical protein
MALGFPTNPSLGQTYTTGSGQTYVWDGVAWTIKTQSDQTINNISATTITIQNTSTIGGAAIITSATIYQYIAKATTTSGLTTIIAGTDTAVSIYGSTATIWNTSTLQTVTSRGNSTTNSISILNATNATSIDTGALTILGGVGIGQDLWIGGDLHVRGHQVLTTSSFYNQIDSGPDILITATTASIFISDISTLQSVTSRGSTTTNKVTFSYPEESTSTTTGAVIITAGLAVGGNINVGQELQFEDANINTSAVVINTTATTVIDSYSSTAYRTAKYLIQVETGLGYNAAFETIEILLLVDNLGAVFSTEYAILSTNGELGEFAADVQGDNKVRLYFTPFRSGTTIVKLLRTTIEW